MESKNRDRGKNQSRSKGAHSKRNFADWARKAAREEQSGEVKQRGGEKPSAAQRRERRPPGKKTRPDAGSESKSRPQRKTDGDDKRTKRSTRPENSKRNKGRNDVAGPGENNYLNRPKKRASLKKGQTRKTGRGSVGGVEQKEYLRDEIRLNKFIAHAGLCSRREADHLIEAGQVTVNGKVVTTLGVKVKSSDKVIVNQQKLSLEPFVYILLNKGRDTISTTDDEKDRNTVLDAIEGATGHRVYPAGRLDRNTMGLLILTNDGDLAHRLMHPSFKVKKTYEVTASRLLSDEELSRLREGVTLEDGPVTPAGVKRNADDPYTVTISVFEGRNHLIRRMIGHLGADVAKLVRVRYAGLRADDLRVGRWRYLKQKEINDLRRLVKLDLLEFNTEKK